MTETSAPTLLTLPLLSEAGVKHGFTTLAAGDMSWSALQTDAGWRNFEAVCGPLGLSARDTITAEQVHGTMVAVAHLCENCGPGNRIPHTDGLITEEPWPLMVVVADCYPVILYEPRAPMLALVHCGWRGTTGGILPRAVARLQRESGGAARDVLAGIGPGICAGCYQAGGEVADAARRAGLAEHLAPDAEVSRWRFDVAGALRQQLHECGLQPSHIETLGRCNFEDVSLPSHRRDGTSVRAAAIAALESRPLLR